MSYVYRHANATRQCRIRSTHATRKRGPRDASCATHRQHAFDDRKGTLHETVEPIGVAPQSLG